MTRSKLTDLDKTQYFLDDTRISLKIQTQSGFKTATYHDLNLNDYIALEEYNNLEANFENKTLTNVKLKFEMKCNKDDISCQDKQTPNHSLDNSFQTGYFGFETDVINQINKDKMALEVKNKELERQLTDLFEIYNIQKMELEISEKQRVIFL